MLGLRKRRKTGDMREIRRASAQLAIALRRTHGRDPWNKYGITKRGGAIWIKRTTGQEGALIGDPLIRKGSHRAWSISRDNNKFFR